MAQHFTSGGYIYWIFPARVGNPFGPFVNPDHFAAFIELILPVAISNALRNPRRAWVHAAIAGALYGSVIASGSRAGWAIATLEILVVPLLAGKSRIAVKTLAILVLFAVLASAVAGWDVLWKRLQDNDPLRYRREIAASTIQMIMRRPWTGFGLGTFSVVYPEFATFDLGLVVDHAHNDWAEWTTEGGLPMLFLALALPAMAIRPGIRSVWGLGILAVCLHSLVDFPVQIPAIAALTFALLGVLSADQRDACLRRS
jgi:O-antigen ligase